MRLKFIVTPRFSAKTRALLSAAAVIFALPAAIVLLASPARPQPSSPAIYHDPQAPVDRRVGDLLGRMTLEEKVSQLMNDSPAIPRLGIPAYNWWNEALHGVARSGRATVFPETIGIAATWDTDLLFRVATAISDEARAKNNEYVRRGKRNIYQGLTFWTPNINLFRDPRWGRGMETYGEDPFLTGRMAVAFIKGMQGDDPKYLKTVATAKHFAVHSGPEPLRHTFDAAVSEQDLRQTYLPHFEAAIREGGAYSVMCAYNSVDGEPACANARLLGDILRKEWGFQGYVVSDCGAVGDISRNHKFVPTAEEGAAKALLAGTDLNCGIEYENLLAAAQKNLVSSADIDRALRRLLMARFKLGMFDPPSMVKYQRIPYSENDSPAHRALALEAAHESIVLLKNDNHALPLSKSLKTIAVIGPDADDVGVLLGNYNGIPTAPVTPLAGIRRKLGPRTRVLYARGSDLAENIPAYETVPASALFLSNASGRRNGLHAAYYASGNFDGVAHRPRELSVPNSGRVVGDIPSNPQPLFTRIDPKIDFQWWDGAPRRDMNDDDFGVRWTGYLAPPVTGTYQLGAIGMNAWELYLDNKLVARFNSFHSHAYRSAAVNLEAGKLYAIRLDFHEYVGDADITLVWSKPGENPLPEAVAAARQADSVILVLGLSPRLEGEEMNVHVDGFDGGDRTDLSLPRQQRDLMEAVAAVGKPVTLVLLNGSALAATWARDRIPAIVEAWYPGQAGGTAIADVLFGDYNPAGRLPVTFYQSVSDLPSFTDYSMRGRTYRFFEGQPLYPFGYGLSYTSFSYSGLHLPARAKAGSDVNVSVTVENAGRISGDEVAEIYLSRQNRPAGAPLRSLVGFTRTTLRPGQKKAVSLTIAAREFSGSGMYEIFAGGGQPGTSAPTVSGTIEIQ